MSSAMQIGTVIACVIAAVSGLVVKMLLDGILARLTFLENTHIHAVDMRATKDRLVDAEDRLRALTRHLGVEIVDNPPCVPFVVKETTSKCREQ